MGTRLSGRCLLRVEALCGGFVKRQRKRTEEIRMWNEAEEEKESAFLKSVK